ncbi:MAG: cytochrome c maturation protein CcmE [Terriglobales bacterium]
MARTRLQFGLALAVIIGTLSWLAFTGIRDSKTYYVTLSELGRDTSGHRLRVAGEVVPGSIVRQPGHLAFTLEQGKLTLPVVYTGNEPPPDTFVDHAQAIATGQLQSNGTFAATAIQAKCASKYEPKGVRATGTKPRESAGTM